MLIRAISLPFALLAIGAAPAPEERRLLLTGFDRIRVDGPFEVRVAEGPPAAIITGDRRAIDRVNVRNQSNILVIGVSVENSDGWRGRDSMAAVTVTVPALRAAHINGGGKLNIASIVGQRVDLSVNGAGSLTVGRLTADQLVTTLTGTGLIKLDTGKALKARFTSYGAGSIDATGVVTNDLTVNSQSSGDSSFTSRFTAAIISLGSGGVRVDGNATCRLSGPGPASCAGKTEGR